MPTSTRKSSLGVGRRGPQKAHIPYRGDNPNVGKKTGIAVQYVERKSDGFEPFDEVIGQADGRTPPRPKSKRKSMPAYDSDDEDEDDDEYGEMPMDVDSPLPSIANVRAPMTPTNGRPSSRPVARTSSVDFDKIPSPRARSAAHGGPGPSRLRRSIVPEEREPSSEPHENDHYDDDDGGMDMNLGGVGDYGDGPPESGSSPRRTSFTQIDQDDDEDDEEFPFGEPAEGDRRSETPKAKGKGKAREASPQGTDDGVEEEIARGLHDLDDAQPSDEEEPEPQPEPQPKKVKVAEQERPPRTKTTSRSKKENWPIRDGVRRSARSHIKPLEWWRGEKVVYGRPDSSATPVLVPQIREIIRIPKEQPEPLTHKRKRGRSRSRTVQPQAPPVVPDVNPEEGWDDDTQPVAKVLEYRNGEETDKRIAWTSQMVNPQRVPNGDWAYEKILWDSDFIAAGQLVIPPKCRKPSKATKDNTYIFYVIEGAVNLKIHDTSLVLASGGMFMVPRGNTYFIENISTRAARLFFTQARKTMNNEDERAVALANRQRRKARRSSSAGPLSGRAESASRMNAADSTPLAARAVSTKI